MTDEWRALGPVPWPRTRDWLLALVVSALLVAESIAGTIEGPAVVNALALGTAGLGLAWRRLAVVPSAALVGFGIAVQAAVSGAASDGGSVLALLWVSLYSCGRWGDRRLSRLGLLAVALGIVVHETNYESYEDIAGMVIGWFVVLAPWPIGRFVNSRHHSEGALTARAELAEHQLDLASTLAAAQERTRIARELHDVVSHGVSVMGLQASAAARTMESAPDQTRESLAAIESTARRTLAELQRMLVVLRTDDDDERSHSHLPGVAEIGPLIERLRSSGLEIDHGVVGDVEDCPPGIGLVAYRIVQESITNVTKYAAGARIDVRVRRLPGALALEVTNDGPPARRGREGNGLRGLRERVSVQRGTFSAGPGETGGFWVAATLPVEDW